MPESVWDDSFVLVGRVGILLETKAHLFYDMAQKQQLLIADISEEDAIDSIKELGKVLTTIS